MAICMKVTAGHVHRWCAPPAESSDGSCRVGCDQMAMRKHNGRGTTQIGIRIPDCYAVKVRALGAQYDSVNDYFMHLIRTQAIRVR